MSTPASQPVPFNADHAEVYDRQFEAIRAVTDALHLLLGVRLQALPDDARTLVAGAGTGAEVRYVAPVFPGWRFTMVDPSEAMLAVARRHAEAEGFADRCTFHVGFVASLPWEAHDAATSLLVSHFLTDAGARQSYFEDIAARLKPGGILFNADLAADRDASSFEPVMALWLDLRDLGTAMPADARARFRAAFGQGVAAHGPTEVEAIIERAGFTDLAQVYQAVLIRGWVATRR